MSLGAVYNNVLYVWLMGGGVLVVSVLGGGILRNWHFLT